jgi:hypothetical protein
MIIEGAAHQPLLSEHFTAAYISATYFKRK